MVNKEARNMQLSSTLRLCVAVALIYAPRMVGVSVSHLPTNWVHLIGFSSLSATILLLLCVDDVVGLFELACSCLHRSGLDYLALTCSAEELPLMPACRHGSRTLSL